MAIHGTYTLEYDDKGNLITEIRKGFSEEYKTTYTYNADNTINTCTDGDKVFKYTYKKDDKNRIKTKTEVNISSDDNYTLVYTYQYDKDGRISKETQKSKNSTYELTYSYDKHNNVIRKSSKRIDKKEISGNSYYEYSVIGIKK